MAENKIFALGEAGLAHVIKSLSQPPSDGGGTTTGLEARVAKVEATLQHACTDITEIKGDVRKLLGAIIASFLLLGGMLIYGYFRLSDQIRDAAKAPPQPPTITQQKSP